MIIDLVIIFIASLLTLGLFDSNRVIMILIFAVISVGLEQLIQYYTKGEHLMIKLLVPGGLAWIIAWLLRSFRVTFATWCAFLFLLFFANYYYRKKYLRIR